MSNTTLERPKPQKMEFQLQPLELGQVDEKNGVIRGVSVITGGVTAKGHNLQVDDTTLLQMKQLCDAKEKVPVKWNHKTGADAVNGYLTNFRIEDKKLKADWHLLKSHSQYGHAIELATRMPTGVGLSASFLGLNELADGTKVYPPNKKRTYFYTLKKGKAAKLPRGAKMFARAEDMLSVDLVSGPAANPDGLFEERVDTLEAGMSKDTNTPGNEPEDQEVDLNAIMAGITALNTRFEGIETRLSAVEVEEEEEEPAAEEGKEFSSMADLAQFLEQRLDAIEDDREKQEFEAFVTGLEGKFEDLQALNEQLVGENEVMAQALQALQEDTGATVELSAGTDEGEPHLKVVKEEKGEDGQPLTAFQARVKELAATKDEKTGELIGEGPAMLLAIKEDGERYQTHLAEIGTFSKQQMAR
jgi:hypothetical protein